MLAATVCPGGGAGTSPLVPAPHPLNRIMPSMPIVTSITEDLFLIITRSFFHSASRGMSS